MLAHHRQDLGSGCVFCSRGLGDDGTVRPGGAPVAPGVRVQGLGFRRQGSGFRAVWGFGGGLRFRV